MDWSKHQLEQNPDMLAEVDNSDLPAATDDVALEPVEKLTLDKLRGAAEDAGLLLEDEIYIQLLAALISGKHVILTGPPGTAKTRLAQVMASVAQEARVCTGFLPTTATADWTTYETIGGLRPSGLDELEFQEGQFLQAMGAKQWLIVDELNRAQFDRAFGQLFTLLSGHPVVLPYSRPGAGGKPLVLLPEEHKRPGFPADILEVPASWRIIATMNVFDKTLLFQMSFALMRRFAFVEVASPTRTVFEALIDRAASGSAAHLAKHLLRLRSIKDLGPAVFIDLARFLEQRLTLSDADDGQLLFEAFYSYLLPQFEGIDDQKGAELFETLKTMLGNAKLVTRLHATLATVLGIELAELSAEQELSAADLGEQIGVGAESAV